jgi:hypothetical protein
MKDGECQEKAEMDGSAKVLPSTLFRASHRASKSFFKELTFLGTFFAIVVTISNLLYGIFHFPLIPIFEISFNAFPAFCQLLVEYLIYSWLIYIISWAFYCTLMVISIFLPVVAFWPQIVVPGWIVDAALLSAAITRVFQATDLVVPRSARAAAENEMTPAMWNDIHAAEGSFWGPIHRSIEKVNSSIWALVDGAQAIIIYPFRSVISQHYANIIRQIVIVIAGFVFMWGYIRLSGYFINLAKCRKLSSPIMIVRKRLSKFFGAVLIGALIVSGMFFVVNGWAVDYTKSYFPASDSHSVLFQKPLAAPHLF